MFDSPQGLIALVDDGLKSNVGLLVLDLEYKSIARGEALCSLLKGHATLMVRYWEHGMQHMHVFRAHTLDIYNGCRDRHK